jgi:hypothetical protein
MIGHADPPWDFIRALSVLLPVSFAGGLAGLVSARLAFRIHPRAA